MKSADLLQAIFASATDYAIITMDAGGDIQTWNAGAEKITGFRFSEVIGQPLAIIFTPEDCATGAPDLEFSNAVNEGRASDYRWHMRKDGSRFWADGVMTPIHNADGEHIGYLKILRDITEKKRAELQLLEMVSIDALTKLPNRSAFNTRIQEVLSASHRSGQIFILQILDLDGFKEVNDMYGHQAGDDLLVQVAQRMKSVTRDTDFIARLGGDEFVILQPDLHSSQLGGSLANKILDVLSQPFKIDGHEMKSGASIGIAVYPQDAKDVEQLLKKADLALYRVKNDGGNGFSYFTERLDTEVHKRNRAIADLKHTVGKRDLRLEYQPNIDSVTGRAIAIEALLRFNNLALSSYSTEELIGLSIDAGLMPGIGEWVLSEVCTQFQRWRSAGLPRIKISVNFCTRELLDARLAEKIDAMFARSGMRGSDLVIEVTERQLLEKQGISVLEALRSRGIEIAIDDFGTGYSSLSYFRSMPIDILKIDQSFLEAVPEDEQSCAIVIAIINLAHTFHFSVVAEGVESAQQAEFLRQHQCEAAQGFFFSRPLKPDDMTAWLLKDYSINERPGASP